MEKEEIYEMIIREMTEHALSRKREESEEEQQLQKQIIDLSVQMKEKLEGIPEDVRQTVEEYIEISSLIADRDCAYLYVQGAKDCVELLKKLGAL